MTCEPNVGMYITFALLQILIIVGALIGYKFKDSIITIALFSSIVASLTIMFLPYILNMLSARCVI